MVHSNPIELSDVQLEHIVLAGARARRTGPASSAPPPAMCSDAVVGGCSAITPTLPTFPIIPTAQRSAHLSHLLGCANELLRRQAFAQLAEGRTALDSPAAVKDYLRMHFRTRDHECFVVVFLNCQQHVLGVEEMFRGTLSQTAVYPREVVKRALAYNAAGVILSHNHPSGVAEPSRADECITAQLKSALSLVDIRVYDHMVVAGMTVLSFAERGLL